MESNIEENSRFICVTSHLWVHWLWWITILKQINMLKVKFYHYFQNCITGMLIFHDIWWISPSCHIITKRNIQNTNVKKTWYNEPALRKTLLENLNVRMEVGIYISKTISCSTSSKHSCQAETKKKKTMHECVLSVRKAHISTKCR